MRGSRVTKGPRKNNFSATDVAQTLSVCGVPTLRDALWSTPGQHECRRHIAHAANAKLFSRFPRWLQSSSLPHWTPSMLDPDRRKKMISLRLSEEEFELLKANYHTHGARNVSDLARQALHHIMTGSPVPTTGPLAPQPDFAADRKSVV